MVGSSLRFIWDNKRLLVGLVLFLFLCLLAIFEPLLVKWMLGDVSPMTTGTFDIYLGPSTKHWLGTERFGRDVLAILLVGLRYSLEIGLLAGVLATAVGIVVGFIAGFEGGRVDATLRSLDRKSVV